MKRLVGGFLFAHLGTIFFRNVPCKCLIVCVFISSHICTSHMLVGETVYRDGGDQPAHGFGHEVTSVLGGECFTRAPSRHRYRLGCTREGRRSPRWTMIKPPL